MTEKYYPEIDPNPSFPTVEEGVLVKWVKNKTFEQSVMQRPATIDGANNEYVFYDGPPFANGLPHYGHLLTGFVKDLYARYHTMRGQRVERRFGWDCHGLPAEMGVEKELKISGRQQITEYGIGNFNDQCRSSVMKYAGEWEHYVNRQARWVDFEHDYKTMDKNFMESVLWAFKQLFDKGMIYQSHRVMPYSWAAETPLSNFETKLDNSYRNKTDKAVTVKFKLKDKPAGAPDADNYYILAWTTTPWTLPSNLALAASTELNYAFYPHDGDCYIVAEQSFPGYAFVLPGMTNDKGEFQKDENGEFIQLTEGGVTIPLRNGSDLIGLEFEPLFPYFKDHPNAFKILDGSSFIEEGSGTGIVHMAPGFGEDDQRVCAEAGIDVVVPVDEQGKYSDEIFDLDDLALKGMNVVAQTEGQLDDEPYKPEQVAKYGLVNLRVIDWLKKHNKLIKQEDYNHNYPHCWRTDTPLIYRALPSWYVKVTEFRDRAVELNKQINWIPEHIRDGQMGHMLATAPDWSISRNRFWGTPIPIWQTESGKTKAFGSIAELEAFFGQKVEDLHRPYIDELTKEEDGETWQRVSDVFDCWFESGSMPFAQVHYPFENKEWFETHFPADFITEYVGQTRGWFNTLIILSTALFDKPPFKNCICHGVVLDAETGMKYSKRLKNYKDPLEVTDQYGADALRWLMIASPVMRGADLSVDPEGKFIRDVVRLNIKPVWNAYNFFTLYANADGVNATFETSSDNLMDRYILAKCAEAVDTMRTGLDAYDTPTACQAMSDFFEVLNNWYIRRNKDRFWNEGGSADTDQAAYNTLYTVLVTMCKAAAPVLPLTLEAVYQGLTGEASVHLEDFPDVAAFPQDHDLTADMDRVRDACNAVLSVRSAVNIRIRQPLASATLYGTGAERLRGFSGLVRDEVNVKNVVFSDDLSAVAEHKLKLHNQVLGKRLPAKMKQIIPASKQGKWELNDGALHIEGETLLTEEYDLHLEPKDGVDGAAALASNDALVVLDLNVTSELEAEGKARDLVRLIQQARKDAGLNVSDRINLLLQVPESANNAIAQFGDYIAEQTLAVSVQQGEATAATHHTEQQLDGESVVIGLSVAAQAA